MYILWSTHLKSYSLGSEGEEYYICGLLDSRSGETNQDRRMMGRHREWKAEGRNGLEWATLPPTSSLPPSDPGWVRFLHGRQGVPGQSSASTNFPHLRPPYLKVSAGYRTRDHVTVFCLRALRGRHFDSLTPTVSLKCVYLVGSNYTINKTCSFTESLRLKIQA